MNWPPAKAWTSIAGKNGQRHFVSINYSIKSSERWVLMMSVLDSSIVVRVPWSQLINPSKWKCGWDENNSFHSSEIFDNKSEAISDSCVHPSFDSGLTIPISKDTIRPWFTNS